MRVCVCVSVCEASVRTVLEQWRISSGWESQHDEYEWFPTCLNSAAAPLPWHHQKHLVPNVGESGILLRKNANVGSNQSKVVANSCMYIKLPRRVDHLFFKDKWN